MSHHGALLTGLAQWLDDNGFGLYRESAVYAETERGIVFSAFPETPDELIAVTLYLPEFTRLSPTAERRLTGSSVQIKYRLGKHPLEGVEFFDRLSARIDGQRLTLGPLAATGSFTSYAPLGQNNAGRWLYSTNWRLTALESL